MTDRDRRSGARTPVPARRGAEPGRGARSHGRVDPRSHDTAHQPPRRSARPAPAREQRPASRPAHTAAATPVPLGRQRVAPSRKQTKKGAPPEPQARRRPPASQQPLQRRARRPRSVRRNHPGVFRAGQPRRRLIALFVGSVLVFGAILFRVGMLQTADAGSYTLAGTHQRTRETLLPASRGVIFDRNGDELALSVPASTVFVNPKLVVDPDGTAAALAIALNLSPDRQKVLADAMGLKQKSFVYVARQIDDQAARTAMALKLAGVGSYREDTRVVPGGDLAKGVIGQTDIDNKGTAGIEMQYDEMLTGTAGERITERDRQGNAIPGSGTVSVPAVPGKDLVLTIDRSIQFSLEQALLARASELRARGGTAIVQETSTGNILAMASVRRDDVGVYRVTGANVAAVDCYEPGSVAKVITISAGLNEGVVTPGTTLQVPGVRTFDAGTQWAFTIRDAEPHNLQTMSVRDILVHSSNLGTVMVSQQIGPQKQYNYMKAFGLGDRSPLEFPGESKGILNPWEKWQGTEKITPAYGYGVCATAIQLVGAVNVIANNGVYVEPRLVQATIADNGALVATAPAATHEVVTPAVADQMNQMMRGVVCDGTAKLAQVDGITVAGKTGTGIKNLGGQYGVQGKDRAYYSSFVGFFPAEAPKVTTLISIDEPSAGDLSRFGGTAAAPVFHAVVPTIMHQLGIQPPTTTGGCPKK